MKLRDVKSPTDLRAAIDSIFHDCWRQNEKRVWRMNTFMRFFRGFHHVVKTGPNIDDPVTVDDRVAFEVVQLTRPTLRQETAGFLNTIPQMDPIPSMTGIVASERARATARMANSRMRCYPEYFDTIYNARLGASIYGASWVKQTWNPYLERNNKLVGDVDWSYINIRDAIADYRATRERDVRYMFHRRALPREQAESWWPVDFEGQPTTGKFVAFQTRAQASTGTDLEYYYSRSPAGVKENELVEVIEAWIRPSPTMPQGALIIYSGMTLLYVHMEGASFALPDAMWPWVLINGLNKVPGKLYADGLMPDLMPLQISINHMASILRESATHASAATLITSRDAEIAEGAIDNMAGTVLEVNGNVTNAAMWNQAPGPQQGVMAYSQALQEQWNNVGTQVNAARGLTDGQANAKLLSYQQELGDSTHAPDRIIWGNQIATVLRNDARLTYAHYDQGRYYRILGPNNLPMTLSFDAEDFDPDTDFVFDPMSAPPANRELAEQKVMEAFQYGVLEDTPGAKRARSMIRRFQDGSDTRDPKEAHRDRVRREQMLFILKGQVPQVLDRDDDAVHLEEDEVFTISPEFLDMPLNLQEEYLQHMMIHQQSYAMKQQALADQQAMLDPGAAGALGPGTQATNNPQDPNQVPDGGPEGGKRTAESPLSGGASAGPDSISKAPSAKGPPR